MTGTDDPLAQLVERLNDHVHRKSNRLPLDQALAQLFAALTLYETMMPDTPSDGLHYLFNMMKDARDRAMEGPSGRRDKRDEAEVKVAKIAAVRYFTDSKGKAEARKHVADLLGTTAKKLKRLETQWLKRQSRSDGMPVSRGTLAPEQDIDWALMMIRQTVELGIDPDTFIRDSCAE